MIVTTGIAIRIISRLNDYFGTPISSDADIQNMNLTNQRILVTGGGGFVGSHLANRLASNKNKVMVADNFSSGERTWIENEVELTNVDLTDSSAVNELFNDDFDAVFHLASKKNVNTTDSSRQFRENTGMTQNILHAARECSISNIVYTSSSTIYGEAPQPTPEDYAPLEPISIYGASKLADEGILSTYAHSYDFSVWNFRFANVVGTRLRGAVIPDFIEKLQSNPRKLTILGDGRQEKSYLHINDCIDGIFHAVENTPKSKHSSGPMYTYNLGTRTTTSVNRIADIVCDVLDVDPIYEYTGGDRGWIGDVPRMKLSIEKLSALGWEPQMESDGAVRTAAKALANEL